ncbi:helicase associated domain-containing protein [Sinomonas atrocyanea]
MDREMSRRLARDAAGLPVPKQQGDAGFAARVEDLAAFIRDRSRVPAASAEDPAEARLGAWLGKQRAGDRKGCLSEQRGRMLEAVLGPDWSSNR